MSTSSATNASSGNTESIKRSCPTCEASCGLIMQVDRNENKVISIKGDPDDPRSKGYVCAKSQAFNYVYEDPERLRRPVKKTDNGWEEISWDEAFKLAGSKLREIRNQHGKDTLAVYYGEPNGHNAATNLYTQLFLSMMDTERFFSPGNIDQQPKHISSYFLYGEEWFFPIPDLERTDYFICMGGNPAVSQGSLMGAPDIKGRLQALKKRGGESVVIDPRRTETAELCDQHLFIRPGSDTFFLLAFVNEIFRNEWVKLGHLNNTVDGIEQLNDIVAPYTPERVASVTGVSADQLRQLVSEYCAQDKAVLYGRIGLCTQQFGTLASWLVDVVNIITGHFDREGCAMFSRPATGQHEPTDVLKPLMADRYTARSTGFPEKFGQLPASHFGKELAYRGDDQVRGMLTLAGNPVISVPNGKLIREGLEQIEFYVAIDIYINETTSQADVILPPLHQLEHSNYDLMFSAFSSRNVATYSPQSLTADPGGMEQWEIMLRLMGEMFETPWESLDDMMADGMAAQVAEGLQANYPAVTSEKVRTSMGEQRGYERYLDTMLRAGPYGDKFGEQKGMSLATLKEAGTIDMGPMQSQLPKMLRTKNKRLNLIHSYIVDDLTRLEKALSDGLTDADKFLLIGRRQIRDMNSWLHNIHSYIKGKNRCTLMVNPKDANKLNIDTGGKVRVKSRIGEVIADVEVTESMMPGVVSLPHGWGHRYSDSQQTLANNKHPGASCNDLVDDEILDIPSGTSVVNGVQVELLAI